MKKKTTYQKAQLLYAPINKRGIAFALDWYLGYVFATIPVGFLWNQLTGEQQINTDLTLFAGHNGLLAGGLGLLFGIFYFFVVPAFVWEGQTPGKKLLGIKITAEDGKKLPVGRLAIRQIVGILFLESAFMFSGNYLKQMLSIVATAQAGQYLNYGTAALFVVSVILTLKGNRAIHDFLAHSIVIEN